MQKFTFPGHPGYADHWKYCTQNRVPFVAIKPARKYAFVEFDVYEMVQLDGLPGEQPCDFIIDLYKCYARFFNLPKERFSCVGGSNNLGFIVFNEHAQIFANQLFDHLLRFVKGQQSSARSQKS